MKQEMQVIIAEWKIVQSWKNALFASKKKQGNNKESHAFYEILESPDKTNWRVNLALLHTFVNAFFKTYAKKTQTSDL